MPTDLLRKKITARLEGWKTEGFPSTSGYILAGQELLKWKERTGMPGLWEKPPVMVTATLDDGWGNGLKPIHLYARLAGIEVIRLGLLQPVREIVAASDQYGPDILGLTILQLDSMEDLDEIVKSLSSDTKILAGGPVFKRTKNHNWRQRGYYAAGNVSSFLHFLLNELAEIN